MAEIGAHEVRFGSGVADKFAPVKKALLDFLSPKKSAEGYMRRYDSLTDRLPDQAQKIADKLRPVAENASKMYGIGMLADKIILATAAAAGVAVLGGSEGGRKLLGKATGEVGSFVKNVGTRTRGIVEAGLATMLAAKVIRKEPAPVLRPTTTVEPAPPQVVSPAVVLAVRANGDKPHNGAAPKNGAHPLEAPVQAPVAIAVEAAPAVAGENRGYEPNPVRGNIGGVGPRRETPPERFGKGNVDFSVPFHKMDAYTSSHLAGALSDQLGLEFPRETPDIPPGGVVEEDRMGPATQKALGKREAIFRKFEEAKRQFDRTVLAALGQRTAESVANLANVAGDGVQLSLGQMYEEAVTKDKEHAREPGYFMDKGAFVQKATQLLARVRGTQ